MPLANKLQTVNYYSTLRILCPGFSNTERFTQKIVMQDQTSLIVLGIYTLIYLIVFLIQRTEINKLKEINSSMKTFMDIFKVDEIKKYVELRNERVMMDAEKFVLDHDKVKEIMKISIEETVGHLGDIYFKQLLEQNREMLGIIISVLRSLPKEERLGFVKSRLKINQEVYIRMLEDVNDLDEDESDVDISKPK